MKRTIGCRRETFLRKTTARSVAKPAGQPLTSGSQAVYAVAFGPGGRTLASGSIDGAVRLWNLNVDYATERICATAGQLTHQQWQAYISQLPYHSTFALSTARGRLRVGPAREHRGHLG